MQSSRGDNEVVMPHERVELRDRVGNLGAHPTVGLPRQRQLGHDALGRKMLEQPLTAFEPDEMRAEAHHDSHAPLGGFAPQLRPHWPRARRPDHMPCRPGVAGRIIRVGRQRLPFAG